MWPFCRFRGMIRPNMALSYEDSCRIARRKSMAMVGYLRARRSVYDPLSPEWQRKMDMRGLSNCRKAHFRLKEKS